MPYFVVVDSETVQYEAVLNPALHAASGAGIQAVQLIANKSGPPPHRGYGLGRW